MEEIINNDKDIRMFKLIGSMPQHRPGDLLYLPHIRADYCVWAEEPFYKVDLGMIDSSPDHFEEIFVDFKIGDEFHFVAMNGIVVSDLFLPQKHAGFLRYGNGFKTTEDAEWANEQIRKFFDEKGYVLTQTDFLQIIQWINDGNAIEKIRTRYLL